MVRIIILVINSGSSSLKFKVFDREKSLIRGIADGIGSKSSFLEYTSKKTNTLKKQMKNHKQALGMILDLIMQEKIVHSPEEIKAVAHRVVHGGEHFSKAVILGKKEISKIEKLNGLAPLHNPANLEGIKNCIKALPKAKQVAVFDTGFHASIPQKAFLYGLPYSFYSEMGIRRYGFHGTSHSYVSEKAAEILKKKSENLKIITCHLGNGSSISAVRKGKSTDTSMGFTPLEGLVMGTRCGDIDPAVIGYVMRKKGLSIGQTEKILNKESGLLGISGISHDVRKLWAAEKKGSKKASLALDVLAYRAAKYIGAYAAAMNGADAIVFTGGIGENAFYVRERILSHFGYLGLRLDKKKNQSSSTIITSKGSKVKALVIPTDEELQIAREALKAVSQ